MKTQVKIQLLGSSFTIQSNEEQEHIEQVLDYLTKKIQEVQEKTRASEPIKIAILASLNIVDELLLIKNRLTAQKDGHPQADEEIDKITRQLIERIDSALEEKQSYRLSDSNPFSFE